MRCEAHAPNGRTTLVSLSWFISAYERLCRVREGQAHLATRKHALVHLAQPQRPLGLATGRTMVPVYAALRQQLGRLGSQQQRQIRADWLSFNLDEYVSLAPYDSRSFKAFMAGQLQGPLGLRPEQVLLPDGLAAWLPGRCDYPRLPCMPWLPGCLAA